MDTFAELTAAWPMVMTEGVVAVLIVVLLREWVRPDIALMGALGVLMAGGVIGPEVAFDGFSNAAVITIAALYVVAAGVQQTDALAFLDRVLFGRARSLPRVLLRLMLPTALISAFVNNTPLVAMLVPRVQAWAQRSGVPASKLLIPLSYASVVGGTITLLGTSTNLVVSGLLAQASGAGFGVFTLTAVGLPVTLAAVAYTAVLGHRALPARDAPVRPHAYLEVVTVEVRVGANGGVAGRTVEAAGLRALGRAYLVHLHRGEHLVGPVEPSEVLQPGDVLAFSGDAAVLPELLERPGLERLVAGLHQNGHERLPLYEAVVASSSPLVGRTLKEADFRATYGGGVLAIQRRDEPVTARLGSVPLRAGDLLLIEARPGFDRRWGTDRQTFYLVAPRVPGSEGPRRSKAPVALGLFAAMVVLSAAGLVPLVTAAFLAALGTVATRCLSVAEARRALDLPVLLMIAAAFGIGAAIEASGLATAVAHPLVATGAAFGLFAALAAVYVVTNVLTELLTNAAAAALVFPVAFATAADLGADPVPFAVAVAVAASAGFATPFGYQTNLMVMSAGGYRVADYARAGLPLNLLVGGVTLAAIYLVWL